MPALLHVPCLRSPTLPLEPQKHYNTPSHVLQRRTPGWHLLILRTGKDKNKETGLGPLLRHLQKSAGRQMLRFLLSGTPGKTLLAHTSVCVCVCVCVCRHTSGVCVQIKHTTHRCKEEKLRYEAGLKRKVLSGSTSNRIRFVFASGGIVKKKNLDLCPGLMEGFTVSIISIIFQLATAFASLCSDRDRSVAFSLSKHRCRDQSPAKSPKV